MRRLWLTLLFGVLAVVVQPREAVANAPVWTCTMVYDYSDLSYGRLDCGYHSSISVGGGGGSPVGGPFYNGGTNFGNGWNMTTTIGGGTGDYPKGGGAGITPTASPNVPTETPTTVDPVTPDPAEETPDPDDPCAALDSGPGPSGRVPVAFAGVGFGTGERLGSKQNLGRLTGLESADPSFLKPVETPHYSLKGPFAVQPKVPDPRPVLTAARLEYLKSLAPAVIEKFGLVLDSDFIWKSFSVAATFGLWYQAYEIADWMNGSNGMAVAADDAWFIKNDPDLYAKKHGCK